MSIIPELDSMLLRITASLDNADNTFREVQRTARELGETIEMVNAMIRAMQASIKDIKLKEK